MSKALYRKYRSKSLSEVIGQSHITDILARAITSGRVSHAYLLTGPRGVGKTSVARILAHEINGLAYDDSTHLDIIEIDAASNNGVEDVRDLREKVQIAPTSAKRKIYIIDEVHMLSKAAFNALLKTLEEPPEHVVFILATTNVEKLPATIISRTQRFSFRPITTTDAVKHLGNIAQAEGIKINDDALQLIAERGDGSFRDSISLLDQLSSLVDDQQTVTAELIENTLGLTPAHTIDNILAAVEARDLGRLIKLLNTAYDEGVSGTLLASQLTSAIVKSLAQKPQLLPLLDGLMDVAKSPQPELKLISVLGISTNAKPSVKTVALAAPVHEVSASIAELERPVPKAKPVTKPATKPATQPSAPAVALAAATKPLGEAKPFDWAALIEYTRTHYVALYSVLSKCSYEITGDRLILYTNSHFYKKKLDDSKYSPLISKCLQEIGVFNLNVETIPTAMPPKDGAAATIAAIMGGGEEIVLET